MITSSTPLERMLLEHEGLRLTPYRCTANKLTIGCGRNLDDVGLSESECVAFGGVMPKDYPHLKLTEAQALLLLRNDIKRCEAGLDTYLPWWRALNEARRVALCDLCFNLGIGGLMKFKSALAALKAEQYALAAKHFLDSRWATQVGNRAKRVAKMIETGKFI
jgi:lysozyme